MCKLLSVHSSSSAGSPSISFISLIFIISSWSLTYFSLLQILSFSLVTSSIFFSSFGINSAFFFRFSSHPTVHFFGSHHLRMSWYQPNSIHPTHEYSPASLPCLKQSSDFAFPVTKQSIRGRISIYHMQFLSKDELKIRRVLYFKKVGIFSFSNKRSTIYFFSRILKSIISLDIVYFNWNLLKEININKAFISLA